ncbi:MAG: hypothetical protein K1X94_28535 [Sandaracinaceae bacterium]|nr:hypothetical protein [Sandaracinaceae bacterium]
MSNAPTTEIQTARDACKALRELSRQPYRFLTDRQRASYGEALATARALRASIPFVEETLVDLGL